MLIAANLYELTQQYSHSAAITHTGLKLTRYVVIFVFLKEKKLFISLL